MKRKFLFSFFETPQGKLLLEQEKKYLARSITVSCQQSILQIGYVGWEDEFIDCTLYTKYSILDAQGKGSNDAHRVCAKSFKLPIKSESIDLVIVPHLIEFDAYRFQTMREIERILKPNADIIILSFNPFNLSVLMQSLWNKGLSHSWRRHFISRTRMADWLKLLNFEIKSTAEFTIDSTVTTLSRFKPGRMTFFSMAYAVKAVKRQYSLIPLTPIKAQSSPDLSTAISFKNYKKQDKKYD